MSSNLLYDEKVVSINAIRKQVERFINEDGKPDDRNFVDFLAQEFNDLKTTVSNLKSSNSNEFIRLCNHIDNILTTIQALLEADKSTIPSVLERELGDKFLFNKLFSKSAEIYSALNRKLNYLSQIVNQLQTKEVKTKEDIKKNVESVYKYIDKLKKDSEQYGDALYGKLYQKLEEIEKENLISHQDLKKKYNEIIEIIKGETKEVDRDGIEESFEPLVNDLIETELNEKGKFVSLLTDKIVEISEEKDAELQKKFRTIVEHLVGKGTQSNESIARQNTVTGLRSLSETDVDEILGRKIIGIVEKKSGFGDALANIGNRITSALTFGGDDTAKKFFDGFSFSIYYYKVIIIDSNARIEKETLPKNLKQLKDKGLDDEFNTVINKQENKVAGNTEKYKYFNRTIPHCVEIESEKIDTTLFMYYTEFGRAYFFLSQDASKFFKDQVKKILCKKITNIERVEKKLSKLAANYTIPKVEVAIYNNKGFFVPSDGVGVIASKGGETILSEELEKQLDTIIGKIKKKYNSKKIVQYFKKKEYFNSEGSWYYWTTNNPEKYLAVKMFEPLKIEKQNQKKSEKENFKDYVTNNIWKKIIATKSLSEMQEWINTFVQKDAGVLGNSRLLFKMINYIEKASIYSVIIILPIVFSIYMWKPTLILPDLRNKDKVLNSNLNRLEQYVMLDSQKYRKDKLQINKRLFEIEESINIEPKSDLNDNDLALIEESYKPFRFDYQKSEVENLLSENDHKRLLRIAQNLHLSDNQWFIMIIRYDNKNDKWNMERAKNIKKFLIEHGVDETSIKISDEVDEQVYAGVRIKLSLEKGKRANKS